MSTKSDSGPHGEESTAPRVVVLAGPNGSGKSTFARSILLGPLQVDEFVNADVIAAGLSAFDPQSVAVAAGRLMLSRLRQLAAARSNFAFETTLASRTFAPWISQLTEQGYKFHLVFLWLDSSRAAIGRVDDRVRRGGHFVAEDIIRRRYSAGIRNFFSLYRPLAFTWQMFDNNGKGPVLIAAGRGNTADLVVDITAWDAVLESSYDT